MRRKNCARGGTPFSQECGDQPGGNARYRAGSVKSRNVGLRRPRDVGLAAMLDSPERYAVEALASFKLSSRNLERTRLTGVLHISSVETAVDVLLRSDNTAENVNRVAQLFFRNSSRLGHTSLLNWNAAY